MFLFAPTVPSEPRPKNTARTVSAGSMSSDGSYGRLRPDTSSVMPTVNRRRGRSRASSANTPAIIAGVTSFDDRPYRPPVTRGISARSPSVCASASAVITSRNSGSPFEPGSLVRSSTAIRRALAGSASSSARTGNGRNSRDLQHADPLAAGVQVGHGLRGGLRARAHHDDDPVGFRVTGVLHRVVPAPGALGEGVHRVFHRGRHGGVERVGRLPRLEVHVGVLRGAPDERVLRCQRPAAVRADQFLGHERAQVVVGQQLDRVQLVRGAEPVEEMHERHPRRKRHGLRHQREVVRLLDRRGGQQRETGLPHRHHVGVVTEDRQPLRGQRPGRHVHHARGQLTSDLVHVRDHQQQALRGGEGGGQRTALQRAVQGTGGAALALHLHHARARRPAGWGVSCWTTRPRARPSATTA